MTGMLDAAAGFDDECPGKEDLHVAAIVNYFGITDVPDVLAGKNRQDWAVKWFGDLENRAELAKRLSPMTHVRNGFLLSLRFTVIWTPCPVPAGGSIA